MLELFDDLYEQDCLRGGRIVAATFGVRAMLEGVTGAAKAWREVRRHGARRPSGRETPRREDVMATCVQDVRYAFRSLRKSMGFTVVSVVTLALGIGANTAIFSVVNAVLLRPLPFERPEELALLWTNNQTEGQNRYFVSPRDFNDWRAWNESFRSLAAFWRTEVTVTDGENDPARFTTAWSTANIFSVLGITPAVGRMFGEQDGAGSPLVAVLSYGTWQRRYGGDPSVVGKTISVDGAPATIVGVLPNQMIYPEDAEFWLNMNWPMEIQGRGARWMNAVGRLGVGTTLEQARADMTRIARRLADEHPADVGWGVTIEGMNDAVIGDMRRALFVLLGATAFILLIACANVANLTLSRSESRHREIAVRSALGAGQNRIVRQLLTESMVLAALGSAVGLGLAFAGIKVLTLTGPADLTRLDEVGVDIWVLAVVVLSTAFTGLFFGLAPAARLLRVDLQESLREGSKGTTGVARARLRSGFVVTQFALALVLVISAGLLIRSFANLRATDPGFRTGGILTMQMNLPSGPYPGYPQIIQFYGDFVARLEAIPGVETASLASTLPLGESHDYYQAFSIAGRETPREGDEFRGYFRQVDADFFATLGAPLLRGRQFTGDDRADAPGVVIINDALAGRYWPGEDPIGERIYGVADNYGPLGGILIDDVEIVGVVSNLKYGGLRLESEPAVYFPTQQAPFRHMTVAVRTARDPNALVPAVRNELRALDPDLPITDISTMERILAESIARDRFTMLLLGLFGVVALALASVGIYGVLSYNVEQRTNEVGIRMALGANPGDVIKMVLRNGLQLLGLGLGIGVAGALVCTRLLASQLFGVSSTDPLIFGGVVALLAAVAILASLLPAWRATHVDPLEALR